MNNLAQEPERGFYDYLEVLYRRRWAATLVAAGVFGALAAYAFCSTPVYRATALLEFEKPRDLAASADSFQPSEEDYIPTKARLVTSDTALQDVFDALQLGATEEFHGGMEYLRKAVTALPVPRTRLLSIDVESVDARRAARVADALAERFVRENVENELAMPRAVLAELDTRTRRGDPRRVYDALPAVQASQAVQDVKAKLLAAQQDLARLRAAYKDDHPLVVAAKNQLALLTAARDRAVDDVVRRFKTELAGRYRPNNVRLVEVPRPPARPVRPRKQLALLLGAIGGLLLGGLVAVGLDTLDQTVRTNRDFERGVGLPLLGHIPASRPKRGERVYAPLVGGAATPSSEAFRNLRTMVLFAKADDEEPALLVTSAAQQEGKSFVAANLAVALSQLGRKVLLVDGDLRRPSQHQLLGAVPRRGLVDLLAGRTADPGDIVTKTEVPNLDVVLGGRRASNPSELLEQERLAQLVAWARGRYDRVLIDCPPVFPVSDVLVWGRHVRSALLVSRAGRTRLPLIRMACARLGQGGIEVLGGVINGTARSALYASHDFDRYCRDAARLPPEEEAA